MVRPFFSFRALGLLAALLVVGLGFTSCDSSEPGKLSLDEYEGPEGEALVRYILKTLPPVHPEIPKVYTVVKGQKLKSTSMDFVRRMADLKLTFVSGEVLTVQQQDKSIVDPRSGLSPVTIQIAELKRAGGDGFVAIGGWAYKDVFERHRYKLLKTPGGYEVQHQERVEGNYVNDPTVKPAP